jgi:hypothetical protein
VAAVAVLAQSSNDLWVIEHFAADAGLEVEPLLERIRARRHDTVTIGD